MYMCDGSEYDVYLLTANTIILAKHVTFQHVSEVMWHNFPAVQYLLNTISMYGEFPTVRVILV